MKVKEWMKIYSEIERDFSFSRSREIEARGKLSRILGNNFLSINELKDLIPREVFVVGFSPSLEKEIEIIRDGDFVIAADESSLILYDSGIKPSIVMTDLDGDVERYYGMDSIFGIHAHGDNIHLLHHASHFRKRFGTTQIEPVWNVYNFGGFTDGDRGIFLAHHFGAKKIHLVGFDFENPRLKKGKDMEKKRKKLLWAKMLVDYLRDRGANIIIEKVR